MKCFVGKIGRLWITALLLAVCTVLGGTTVAAQTELQANEITGSCRLSASGHVGALEELRDGNLYNEFVVSGQGEQSLTVESGDVQAAGVYIKWGKYAAPWMLEAILTDGTVEFSEHGKYGLLQEYVQLPENTASFRMITTDGEANPLRIVELEVYSAGTLPDSVHFWEPTPTTVEIMYVSTHQDDEILFFGGAIPCYSGELDYDSLVVYTAYDNNNRLHEALEGLWTCGLTQHPVFLDNIDKFTSYIDRARTFWDENKVIAELTELILKHRPQVIVSQDVDGEYGHGQHKLTVYCLQQALEKAVDEQYLSENFPECESWQVSKCYLHLYAENNISMPWDTMILESIGGKTAYEVACDAYQCHVSQHKFDYAVSLTARGHDCRSFGLYRTLVGTDAAKNDFFENVTLRYQHVRPPESELVSYLEPVGETGWLYRRIDGEWEISEYIRYCRVDGVTGWYAADYTGSLIEPAVRLIPVKDDYSLELSVYETLTKISDRPTVYEYSDGISVSGLAVRYCSVGTGEVGFYAVNSDGTITEPITRVEVAYRLPITEPEEKSIFDQLNDGKQRTTDFILIGMCGLMAITAVFLFVSIVNLGRRRNRRRY